MPIEVVISLTFLGTLSLSWLAAEFQSQRWLRIILGICTLALALFMAKVFSLVERFNYNAWYGHATAELLDMVIHEIDAGRKEAVIPALRQLRQDFQPTHENRAHYDELVNEFVRKMTTEDLKPP